MVTADEARLLRATERMRYDLEREDMTLPLAKTVIEIQERIACACVGGRWCCKYRYRVALEAQAIGGRLAWGVSQLLRWRVMNSVMATWSTRRVVNWALAVQLGVVEWDSSVLALTAHDIEHLDVLLDRLIDRGVVVENRRIDPNEILYKLR